MPAVFLPQPKDQPSQNAALPEDIKPIIILESSDEPPSSLSDVSIRPGMADMEYWQNVTAHVENKIRCQSIPKIPRVDYSVVLPPNLKARVKKIMSYDFSESDDLVYIRDEILGKEGAESKSSEAESDLVEKVIELRKREIEESFNESDLSDIERMEHEFHTIELKIDKPLSQSLIHIDHNNWMSKFLCNSDSVTWKSKAYEKDKDLVDKTLDEQAEQLMELSAERFAEWLRSIDSDEVTMTAENIKDLFSIKGDQTLLTSIRSDPKEVNAIAQTVAEKWNRPDIAIEPQYESHIKHRIKKVRRKMMLSAFGRTIPVTERPWYKSSADVPIKGVFPKDLMTGERIFNGIRHLRSVKSIVNFYLKHPKLERPQYLVKCGDFKVVTDASVEQDVPLYEKLGLKY